MNLQGARCAKETLLKEEDHARNSSSNSSQDIEKEELGLRQVLDYRSLIIARRTVLMIQQHLAHGAKSPRYNLFCVHSWQGKDMA